MFNTSELTEVKQVLFKTNTRKEHGVKKKDRDKLMLAWRILAVILAVSMIIGVIFGTGELFGGM